MGPPPNTCGTTRRAVRQVRPSPRREGEADVGALCDGEELGGRDPLDGTGRKPATPPAAAQPRNGKNGDTFGDQKMAAVDDDRHGRVDHDVGAT